MCFFEDFKIYILDSGLFRLPLGVCVCTYTMACQTPELLQNLQSSEKCTTFKGGKTQYLMNTLFILCSSQKFMWNMRKQRKWKSQEDGWSRILETDIVQANNVLMDSRWHLFYRVSWPDQFIQVISSAGLERVNL